MNFSGRGWFVLVLFAALATITVAAIAKVYYTGNVEYRQARELLEANNPWEAIEHYDRAMHWYMPHAKHVEQSAKDLWDIGEEAEKNNDRDLALQSYRTIRSAFYAARTLGTPGKDWIARCDQKIVAVASEDPDLIARMPDPKARQDEVAKSLKKNSAPDAAWSLAVEVGFFGWVGSALGFIFFGYGSKGEWKRGRAAFWGLLLFCFYALWIAGLIRA